MSHVLFVDDEPDVLEGLRDALRPWRREWQASLVVGGAAALVELDRTRFDVVVSDMRMPGMDGATLLAHVQERQPWAVRIVLSGSTERGMITRAAGVAHRFMAKPCDVDALARTVSHAARLSDRTQADDGYGAAAALTSLPSPPVLYAELVALLGGGAGMVDVAHLVERDVAISGKVLQLVNSGFFALPRTIARTEEAMTYLGLVTVKAIVLAAELERAFRPATGSIELVSDIARRSAAAAERARAHAGDKAFAAALLHDIGWLVLAESEPANVAALHAQAAAEGRCVSAVELESGRATHAQVGAHLLGLWGLPESIVEAVARHHDELEPGAPAVVAAVNAAVSSAAASTLPA